MEKIISNTELWNMPKEKIVELTKGRQVRIVLTNGEYKEVFIKNILAACNPPCLFVGFLTADNNSIDIEDINSIELKNDKL